MRYAFLLVATLVPFGVVLAEDPDFYAHWGDGKAELSSYKVVQPRYGELRRGYGVLVFVTEDINRETFIKVESPTLAKDRLYVLKLNNMLKFNTGIYDYSVMTSVFSAVEGLQGNRSFELCKITLSAQEWCGHVFEEVQMRQGRLQGALNSYFEREGRQRYELPAAGSFASEDHLLILVRELRGPILAAGEEQVVQLLPALWQLRALHRPRDLVQARLAKGHEERIEVGGDSLAAIPWRLATEGREKTIWVERAYPRRILSWRDSAGGRGELLVTLREPYWQLQSNVDEAFRARLQIP